MDLLRTILVYMSMVFVSSVQTAPQPDVVPSVDLPTPTPFVELTDTPTPVPTPTPTPVPTIDISPNPEYSTIQVGDNGDEVRAMQQRLADYGYYTGEIDGRFGNQTRRAVESFQYQHGLSVDGIAGKNTLTVLYDSTEVRPAPATQTPAPSETPQANPVTAATATESQTPAPTFNPITTELSAAAEAAQATETPAATQEVQLEEAAEQTEAPAETPVPVFGAMEGQVVRVNGVETPVMGDAAQEGEAEALEPYAYGETIYVPFLRVLETAGVNIIATESLEVDEYAFAIGNEIYRLTLGQDQSGNPIDLQAFHNGESVTLTNGDVQLVNDVLYFTADDMTTITGATIENVDDAIVVTFPAAQEEE